MECRPRVTPKFSGGLALSGRHAGVAAVSGTASGSIDFRPPGRCAALPHRCLTGNSTANRVSLRYAARRTLLAKRRLARKHTSIHGTESRPGESQAVRHCLPPPATVAVGGRLQLFKDNWFPLTTDKVVLDWVVKGVKLPFNSRPSLCYTPPFQRMGPESEAKWGPVLQRMLDMEAVEEVIEVSSGGCYSHVFLRPKPNGTNRPIINLKPINARLKGLKFSMTTPQKVLEVLAPGVYTTSVDLKDAYFHVPMHPSHRKYLRFAILGRVFQFKTLPFGLAPAPRIFTQVVKVLLKWCHRKGINMVPYLDDWLLYHTDRELLIEHTRLVVQMAGNLGWVINLEKSELVPAQKFDFLGMTLDTRLSTVRPCERRVEDMLSRARALKNARVVSKRSLLQLQGTMVSLGDLVRLGKLRRRPLQAAVRPLAIHGKPSEMVVVSPALRASVDWWTFKPNLTKPMCFLKNREIVTIVTDASTVGWGATVQDIPIHGVWTQAQRLLHINCLEMLAVKLSLQRAPVSLARKHLSIHTDNMTVRSYLLKQGGTVSHILNRFTRMVWSEIVALNATLSVRHISGSLNVLADALSRPGQVLSGEWVLRQETFLALSQVWFVPSIDLFATKFNAKLPLYVSPCPDQKAEHTDAMSLDWDKIRKPYMFPPFRLIQAVLEKIRQSAVTCLLVTPTWPANPAFPLLVELAVAHPVYLGSHPSLLSQGVGGSVKLYPRPRELGLHVWILSGVHAPRKDFPVGWQPSLQPHNAPRPTAGTTTYGSNSVLGWKATGAAILSRSLPQSWPTTSSQSETED
ncbi:MAG: hypothetical protein DRH37_03745 [Deltaproteobacteria bacterium]|nr:MAG: hypothetical protein DRH37_03745 [Deltaproteobacteria bacterium]